MSVANRCRQRTRDTHAVTGIVTTLVLAMMVVVGCGGQSGGDGTSAPSPTATPRPKLYYQDGGPGAWYPYAQVIFTRSTRYATALRLVTDLGLQPASPCSGTDEGRGTPWQPRDIGQQDTFENGLRAGETPVLWVFVASRSVYNHDVALYFAAPSDWPIRLSKQIAVSLVDNRVIHGCGPGLGDLTPVPGRLYFIDPTQTPVYAQVTFGRSTSYDQALATISALGFRLADPCYEQAQPKPTWHAMGQESGYATTNSLVVATTGANSAAWQQQIASTSGVANIAAPYQPAC